MKLTICVAAAVLILAVTSIVFISLFLSGPPNLQLTVKNEKGRVVFVFRKARATEVVAFSLYSASQKDIVWELRAYPKTTL